MSPTARRRARAVGPRAVATRSDYPTLIRSAGFRTSAQLDVTADFRATVAALLAESERHADELSRVGPPGAHEQQQAERRARLAAIDAGLLRRSVFLARRGD